MYHVKSMEYPVIISYSNNGYVDFAKNLLLNLNSTLQFHKVHFYCLDSDIYNTLTNMSFLNISITFEPVNANVSKQFENYGTANYNGITHTKMNILRNALEKFGFIHFVDCDVVCMKEPLIEHYMKYRECDIVFQHDAGFHSADKFHAPTLYHIWACTGNTSFRASPGTFRVLDKISEYQLKYPSKNDQECLYKYFQDIGISDLRQYTSANLSTYEVAEYTNGYWLHNAIGTLDSTYFFHANHVSGGARKIGLLKKANKWLV